jgi:hypothetical protein
MTSHRNKPFAERFKTMGDEAETAFEQWAHQNDIRCVQYGLNRPNFTKFQFLPAEIRHTPDFLCEQLGKPPKLPKLRTPASKFARHFLAEVKGCGRDQKIKLKHAEFAVIQRWEQFSQRPVIVFAYDNHHMRVSTSMITSFVEWVVTHDEVKTENYFDGGPPKPYWSIPTSLLEWEPLI